MNDSQPSKHAEEPRRFANPAEGLKALEEAFGYWTSKITELSFQYCLALIAANWAFHAKDLLRNSWALSSVLLAILSLFLSALGALVIAEMARRGFVVAVGDRIAWRQRWEVSERIDSEWPFTKRMDFWARLFSWARLVLPFVAGVLFAVGVSCAKPAHPASQGKAVTEGGELNAGQSRLFHTSKGKFVWSS